MILISILKSQCNSTLHNIPSDANKYLSLPSTHRSFCQTGPMWDTTQSSSDTRGQELEQVSFLITVGLTRNINNRRNFRKLVDAWKETWSWVSNMSVMKQVEKIQHIETGLERWFGGEALATHACGQVFGCPACMQIQHACGITDGVTLEGWRPSQGNSRASSLHYKLNCQLLSSSQRPFLNIQDREQKKSGLYIHTHKCVSTHIWTFMEFCVCAWVCVCV